MDCSNTETLLDAYVDGELDPLRNLDIEEHLHGCARCAQSYSDRQAIRGVLKTESLYFQAPAGLQKRIQRSVRQAAKAEAPAGWFSGSWFKIAAPLATAALVVLMLVPYFGGPSSDQLLTQEVVASHIRSLMVNHLADVPSTDEHTVKPWFNGKLDFSPPVGGLAKQGFPLVGGRLDYLNNRPVAALVYQRDKHVINIFIWPVQNGDASAAKPISREGYQLLHWVDRDLNYWAVSDASGNELVALKELIEKQTAPQP